jgi:hypothetical protein
MQPFSLQEIMATLMISVTPSSHLPLLLLRQARPTNKWWKENRDFGLGLEAGLFFCNQPAQHPVNPRRAANEAFARFCCGFVGRVLRRLRLKIQQIRTAVPVFFLRLYQSFAPPHVRNNNMPANLLRQIFLFKE